MLLSAALRRMSASPLSGILKIDREMSSSCWNTCSCRIEWPNWRSNFSAGTLQQRKKWGSLLSSHTPQAFWLRREGREVQTLAPFSPPHSWPITARYPKLFNHLSSCSDEAYCQLNHPSTCQIKYRLGFWCTFCEEMQVHWTEQIYLLFFFYTEQCKARLKLCSLFKGLPLHLTNSAVCTGV